MIHNGLVRASLVLGAFAVALAGPASAQAQTWAFEVDRSSDADHDRVYFADAEPMTLYDGLRLAQANGNGDNGNDAGEAVAEAIEDVTGAGVPEERITFGPFALYERTGFYIDGTIGPSFSSVGALDTGLALNFAGGYMWRMIRFEGDLGYRYHNVASRWGGGSLDIFSLMFNGVVDFDLLPVEELDLYAGAGLGLTYADASRGGSDTNLAVQTMGGVSYALADNLRVRGGVRWMGIRVPRGTGGTTTESFVKLDVGVRLTF